MQIPIFFRKRIILCKKII